MSTYPTSAQLAAFRWTIHEESPDHDRDDCPMDGPRDESDRPIGGAWADERAHGIGNVRDLCLRLIGPDGQGYGHTCAPVGAFHAIARREASAMRSRAFLDGPAVGWTFEDMERFAPSTPR